MKEKTPDKDTTEKHDEWFNRNEKALALRLIELLFEHGIEDPLVIARVLHTDAKQINRALRNLKSRERRNK